VSDEVGMSDDGTVPSVGVGRAVSPLGDVRNVGRVVPYGDGVEMVDMERAR
jgi:hypothetical protein